MTPPIRLLCIDDHELITDGLAARVKAIDDIEIVGRLQSADGLAAEVERLRPDVVLLDLAMPGQSPLDVMGESLRRVPSTRFIVLTAHVRDVNVAAALRLGAAGFFSKDDATGAILDGVRQAARGEQAIGVDVAERLESMESGGHAGNARSRIETLSPREIEVLRLIGRGMSRAEIAQHLVRAIKTVDAHHTSIMRKLDIHDRAELTRYAIREGLVEA